MTNLSWLIYLAGISSTIKGILAFIGILIGVLGIIMLAQSFGAFLDYSHRNEEPKNKKFSRPFSIICFILAIGFEIISGIIPTEKSLYIIAGVETVDSFSKTETAKELGEDGMSIVHDITKIIHNYANEKTKE